MRNSRKSILIFNDNFVLKQTVERVNENMIFSGIRCGLVFIDETFDLIMVQTHRLFA